MQQSRCLIWRGVYSAGGVLLLACALAGKARGAYYGTPTLPNINTNNIVNVTNNPPYNAVPDNATDNTLALSNAIAVAAAGGLTNGASGGTVEIPAGANAYLCGPITMKSSVNLQIDAGAVLRMLPFGTYPGNASFIGATNLTDVEISGSGAVDGQGLPWWTYFATNSSLSRPILVRIQGCSRQLVQNVTFSNAPMFHLSFSGSKGNITVRNVTVQSPSSEATPPAANTDACDVSGTNILVENCHISEGDDDFTCSGGTSGVLLTNNTYGTGHGISIGSYTDSGGVSNITVINCTINGADNGLRIKSDDGRGGLVQNINYYNIGITNVHFPIQIYSYYNEIGTPSSITPYYASTQTVAAVSGNTPIYRNITFSNINATSVSGYPIGIIWARTELPATNIIFNKVNITGDRGFDLYNVSGARFIDCNLLPASGASAFELYNAQAIFTNSAPASTPLTLDGLTTNGCFNTLALYNASGSLANTNVLGNGPITLAASTLTVSNNLSLLPNTVLYFILGSNAPQLAVTGNLTLGGTNYFTAGMGFSNGTYTVMTGGTLTGSLPAMGSLPAGFGYSYSLLTNNSGQVNLVATLPAPTNFLAAATNLQVNLNWNAVSGATNYNLKRGTVSGGPYPTAFGELAATNYTDAAVTNRVSYYYVVTALGAGGESANSVAVSAIPLPSKQPTNLVMQATNGKLQLSWPPDHQGWRLQIQTNPLAAGLAPNPTNWATVPNSTNVMATNVMINPANGSVFLRLVYP